MSRVSDFLVICWCAGLRSLWVYASLRVGRCMGYRPVSQIGDLVMRCLFGRSAVDASIAAGSVSTLWVVRESWDSSLGEWVLVECASYPAPVAFERFGSVVGVVSDWHFESEHRVQLRDVAVDGAVMVLRSVVVERFGGRS